MPGDKLDHRFDAFGLIVPAQATIIAMANDRFQSLIDRKISPRNRRQNVPASSFSEILIQRNELARSVD